ncbi:MAG: hypothetical protein OXJ53_19820 [Gammaproteobacteria bacterium]|nr:hypothetical protein [Gammaproteobacteria bacterium]MDE0271880.1 hypothetical protein [Gammaproteobacteria bacterium]
MRRTTRTEVPVTEDLKNRSVMGRIRNIETGYLRAVRGALAAAMLIGILALAAAVAMFLYGQLATAGSHSADHYFQAPTWESVRREVLPTLSAEPTSANDKKTADETAPGRLKSPDPRILQIAEHLNAQFERNTGNETFFTDRFPKRLLESWIMEESVPPAYSDDYVNELVGISEAIGSDGTINRIGSLNDRAEVIMEALQAFNRAFLVKIDEAELRAASAQTAADEQRAAAANTALFLGLGGLGLLVSILLIVILIRIEAHLHDQVRLQRQANEGARQSLPVLCVVGCALLALSDAPSVKAAGGSAAAEGFSDCDWTIVSEAGSRSGQSRGEVANQLSEEFAIKLKQFDDCAERLETEQVSANAVDSSLGAAGGDRSGRGNSGSDGGGGSEAGEEQKQVAQGEPSGSKASAADAAGSVASRPQTGGAVGSIAGQRSTASGSESVAGRSSKQPRTSPAEDDIARILREAAEKETDPDRQAALWKEYENYVQNL